jgi:hypothetical protein
MNVPSIQSSAMLLNLTISVYTGRKADRSTAAEITTQKQAQSTQAATVQKYLFAGDTDLANIQTHAAQCRRRLAVLTLPWNDAGVRLLPTRLFFQATEELGAMQRKFQELVDAFVAGYTAKVSNAAFSLGQLFDRDEYPNPETIAAKFRFDFAFTPVPAAGDFRVDIPAEAIAQISQRLTSDTQERVEQAVTDLSDRLYDVISHMRDRCLPAPEGAKRTRVYESTLENALELCDIAKGLNLFGDPALENVRAGLEASLQGVGIKDLREDDTVREQVRKSMDDLLALYN